jgi:hypothetical protein
VRTRFENVIGALRKDSMVVTTMYRWTDTKYMWDGSLTCWTVASL